MELSKIAKVTHLLLKLFLVVGCFALIFVNKVVVTLGLPNPLARTLLYTVLSIACLMIVYQVIKVFKSIVIGNPFVTENEIALKKIAIICEVIAILVFIKTIVDFTVLTIFVVVIFGLAGLCAYVLSQLFKQSVFLKEENDMTI